MILRALLLFSAVIGANAQAGEPGGLFVTHNAARSVSRYLSPTTQGSVVFPGLSNLSEIVDVSFAIMNGDWISDDVPAATFELRLNATFASFVVAFADGGNTKGAKVELFSMNNSIFARQTSARYAPGNLLQNFSFSALFMPANRGASGYGVKSLSLMKAMPATPAPTSLLAPGTMLFEHNRAFDMRMFVPSQREIPLIVPGLRNLTGISLVNAVLCGDVVVRCAYGEISELTPSANSLQFVVGVRDSQYDRRALIQLDVTANATVAASQVSARQGLVNETSPSASYASLSSNGALGAAGIGVLSFALTQSPVTPSPTPEPTPSPTPVPPTLTLPQQLATSATTPQPTSLQILSNSTAELTTTTSAESQSRNNAASSPSSLDDSTVAAIAGGAIGAVVLTIGVAVLGYLVGRVSAVDDANAKFPVSRQ